MRVGVEKFVSDEMVGFDVGREHRIELARFGLRAEKLVGSMSAGGNLAQPFGDPREARRIGPRIGRKLFVVAPEHERVSNLLEAGFQQVGGGFF